MRYLVILLLACPGAAAAGQTIYRSVDHTGAVTYSTRPVQGALESTRLQLPPGPSEEQKAAARARLEKTKQLSREIAAAREGKRQAVEEERPATLRRSATTVGAEPTREEVAEEARRKLQERKESVEPTKESTAEDLARRREDRIVLPRQPVQIQPVPAPADIGNGPGPNPGRVQPVPSTGSPGDRAPSGQRGGRRGRGGG